MSPAVFVFLPFALLLLMSKGAGANPETPTRSKTRSSKVMGVLTEKGDFIPFASLTSYEDIDTGSAIIERNGKRYLLASVHEQD